MSDWHHIPIAQPSEYKAISDASIPGQRFTNSLYVVDDDLPRVEEILNMKLVLIDGRMRRINYKHDLDVKEKEIINELSERLISIHSEIVHVDVVSDPHFSNDTPTESRVKINFMNKLEENIAYHDAIILGETPFQTKKYSFFRKDRISDRSALMLSDGTKDSPVPLVSMKYKAITVLFNPDRVTVRYLSVLKRVIRKALEISCNYTIFQEQRALAAFRDSSEEEFLTLCDSTRLRLIQNLQTNMADHRRRVERASAELKASARQLSDKEIELSSLQSTPVAKDKFRQDHDLLRKHDKILKMSVSGSHLIVVTDNLFIEDVLMGRYKIDINVNTNDVKILNLSKRLEYNGYTWDHPHIHGGIPCWGNIESALTRMLSDYDFPIAINMIIDYLQSVKTDDSYGRYFTKWKEDHESRKSKSSFII